MQCSTNFFYSMVQKLNFEKLKKKLALCNSYFKNRQRNAPSNPFEILEYYKQYKELPYNNGEIKNDWFYDCFIEFQKRAGVRNSQFFTPTKTAERIAEIVFEYAEFDERILDACCGFGQITKALKNKGYEQIEAYDNDAEMVDAYFNLTGINARVYDFTNEDESFENKYSLIVSNPPYELKELTKFLEFVYEHLNDTGKAILLIPSGFIDKQRPANLVQVLNKFSLKLREPMSEKFERTSVVAEIVVLSK
jgi:predicted RNA methylase